MIVRASAIPHPVVLSDGQNERRVAIQPAGEMGVGGYGSAGVLAVGEHDVRVAREGARGGRGRGAAVGELGDGGVVCRFSSSSLDWFDPST